AYMLLGALRRCPGMLEGCVGAVLVDGAQELYTKSFARELVFSANLAGCAFIGRPLVEATGSLQNFHVQAQSQHTDKLGAYRLSARELIFRLVEHECPAPPQNLLALHASKRATSNTLALWELVKARLQSGGVSVSEINLRKGAVNDCDGCAYTACLHFGEHGGCYYGGVMVEDVFPAVRACDALILLCPNYNDALSANLTAFINRLTALFRQSRFYDKQLYGIIVSGYSGGDIVARQLISALCMNKSFYLPPRFTMLETANDAGSVLLLEGIKERAAAFAKAIAGG
ncbi:MAG: NAD(P)H-dependent oxidoreductase, partial [Clostridiales bacterium]|nr:NAD(P)H-dependent oxidoreductase [Clostridiales bacterium]